MPPSTLDHKLKLIRLKERALYTLHLRDVELLKFTEIAKNLDAKFPLEDKNLYSEDLAKTIYHRAKDDSSATFCEQNSESITEEKFQEYKKLI